MLWDNIKKLNIKLLFTTWKVFIVSADFYFLYSLIIKVLNLFCQNKLTQARD